MPDTSYRRRTFETAKIGVLFRGQLYTLLLQRTDTIEFSTAAVNDKTERYIHNVECTSRNDKHNGTHAGLAFEVDPRGTTQEYCMMGRNL